jgi:hypothetical protein
LDVKGKTRANGTQPAKANGDDFLALDMGDGSRTGGQLSDGGGGYQQMQLVENNVSRQRRDLAKKTTETPSSFDQQDSYMQSRSTAIESIESTIAELGQIFGQLASMVAQQGEQMQRIDADVDDIETNVSGAQRELMRTLASVTSNRGCVSAGFAHYPEAIADACGGQPDAQDLRGDRRVLPTLCARDVIEAVENEMEIMKACKCLISQSG